MIRSISPRDFLLLSRYRNRGLFLDSVPTLTWGRGIVPLGALLSTFSALTGVFTAVGAREEGDLPLLGQIFHSAGSPYAHFTYLAPQSAVDSPQLPELLEHLIRRVGRRGAHSLIAEVEDGGSAFAALRAAGFSVYARQRIWRLRKLPAAAAAGDGWRPATRRDALPVNLLCGSLVPGMVQQVEPPSWDGMNGYVQYGAGELSAYADLRRGPRGLWLQPFVHLELGGEDLGASLAALVRVLRPKRGRPLYICLRSYQDWLEPAFRELGAEPGPRQAVLVKRTDRPIKEKEFAQMLAAEGRRAEPTTPIQIPTNFVRRELELQTYDQTPNYR